MSKTFRKKTKCEICGDSPAYYSKMAHKVLCKNHLTDAILKIIIAGGAIVGLLYFTGIIQIF